MPSASRRGATRNRWSVAEEESIAARRRQQRSGRARSPMPAHTNLVEVGMNRILRVVIVGAALAFPNAGFSQQGGGGPKVESPWARATPSQAKVGAAYMTIVGGAAADRLVGVASPVATKAEIHQS